MPKLTVLHTIETSGIGGAERVLLNVAGGLVRRGIRSVAALPEGGLLQDALEAQGVRTWLTPSRAWWDLQRLRGLVRLCRQESVDVIQSHLPDHNFYAALAGRVTGRPSVATYHSPMELRHAHQPRQSLKLRVVRSAATRVVAVCDAVRERLIDLGFAPAAVTRIYNGIDGDAFRSAPALGLRRELGWPATTPIVGTVANVRLTKGYEYFVRAARQVVDAHPATRFVAVGDIDPVLGAPVMRLVEDLGLGDHIRFLGYRSDVPALVRDFDVFVLPSTSEGFPLVLIEAMAAGRVVVATRCGGTDEIVRDGSNGYLVPPADAAALAQRLRYVLGSPPDNARLAARALETAGRFTVETMVDGYQRLYEGILNQPFPMAPRAATAARPSC